VSRLLLALALAAGVFAPPGSGGSPDGRFRDANQLARSGDYPGAVAAYAEVAAAGGESASLYWNWAQAAAARGAPGESLWALLRAREVEPGDRAVRREIDRLREALNLDPAEIAPEPLCAVARAVRRFHLDLLAAVFLAASVLLHGLTRLGVTARRGTGAFLVLLVLGVLAATAPLAAGFARPTAAVVRRGAPLFDAASPAAEPRGTLREGEVVPVLETSGGWLRVEDNAGARGWARTADVRRLDRADSD